MQTALTSDASASGWDRSLYAFLAEKQQRSGSMRTVNAYAGMLRDFFGRAGKTPDAVGPQEAFAWAYASWLTGLELDNNIDTGTRAMHFSAMRRLARPTSLRNAGPLTVCR